MRDLVVTMIVLGSLPVILLRPYVGVLMWAWIGLMNPHKLAWGFAETFPFAEIVAITTLIAMSLSKERKRIPWTREVALLTSFTVWVAITTAFAKYRGAALTDLEQFLKIQLMTYVAMMLITDRKKLDQLIAVIVFSLGFYGVKGGIFTIATGGHYHVQGPPGTFIGGNNELGLALIMTLPLMRYLHVRTTNRRIRAVLLASMALTAIAILGTQSRGALLGISAMTLFLIWKSRNRLPLLLAIALIAPTALHLMPQAWYARMATIRTYKHDQSAEGRIHAWKYALAQALRHPIMGEGFALNEGRRASHSIYFQTLGEQGFVGLALFLLLGLSTWRAGSATLKRTSGRQDMRGLRDLAAMVQVSLVGYAVSGAFLSLAYFDLYYYLIVLMVLCKVMAEHAEKTVSEDLPAAKMPAASNAWWVPAKSAVTRPEAGLRLDHREFQTNARGRSGRRQ